MKIGDIEIRGKAVLAPMAGVTDLAYRHICMGMGASLCVTEMVSAKAMQFGDRKSMDIAALEDASRPTAIQIFGDDPSVMAAAARKLMVNNPDAIDINMGCPVPKIAGNNSGAALMKRPEVCGEIVNAVSEAVSVPITVKIRAGWDSDSINAVEIARICEDAGAAAITVHGRTKTQMYSGKADWEIIKAVKSAVSVPVIGNGDVTDAQSACLMLDRTGCDMVMVGRAALGNPWIFREISAYLTESCTILPPPAISERIVVIKRHMDMLCARKGENRGMREARKHVAWYFRGLRGAADFRRRAGELSKLGDLDILLRDVYAANFYATDFEEGDLQ